VNVFATCAQRLIPRRLQTRLLLLLVLVVIVALAAATVAFGVSTRESNAARLARGLYAQVLAADRLLAMHHEANGQVRDRARLQAEFRELQIEWRQAAPAVEKPTLPLLQYTEAMLGQRLPGRLVRLSGSPAQLWVQAEAPAQGWIGIEMLGGPESLRRGLRLSLVTIGLLILVAASWFARSLARPLQRLADAAPGIVAGEPPPPLQSASAEIVELQRALVVAAERTQTAARDRELMLAGLSHDMRTPLARLRYALALAEVDLDQAGVGQAGLDQPTRDAMEADIDEIDAIVGQFIDYVRDGRDEVEEGVDLVMLIRGLAQRESQAGRDWVLSLPETAIVRGRPLALQRAVGNLFVNAVRHGAAPFEAEVVPFESVHTGRANRMAAGWVLRVRDHGPGVPAEHLPDLGRPFHRVDIARATPGSGLGLASVARVAALHHGELRLRNREGGGFEAEISLRSA
jgi:two-component system, OmpR family, osmolarity sensor histidine kinase EnvZ